MLIFLSRSWWFSLIILLVISTTFNVILAYTLKAYYTQFRLTTVFPTHENFYQRANARLPAKQQKRVVLFGDSRIQEWKNLPQLEGFEWINRGIGGETTKQLRARFDPDVIALQPDVVILQLGINDLVAIGVAPQYAKIIKKQCQKNLNFLVETLLAKSIQVILLTIVPPAKPELARLPVWNEQLEQSVAEINQFWLKLSAKPYLQVVDTNKVLQNAQGQWHEHVNRDTLHLTVTGYEYLNQAVTAILRGFK